jgi:hypothetical protein
VLSLTNLVDGQSRGTPAQDSISEPDTDQLPAHVLSWTQEIPMPPRPTCKKKVMDVYRFSSFIDPKKDTTITHDNAMVASHQYMINGFHLPIN